ncbi:hypothetical protein X798_00390, partial [Onchocerca flexuosa]
KLDKTFFAFHEDVTEIERKKEEIDGLHFAQTHTLQKIEECRRRLQLIQILSCAILEALTSFNLNGEK